MSRRAKDEFAPRVPLPVRGGLRIQSSRSGFARHWWSRPWLTLLERYQIGARMGRGRSYAYSGQIETLELLPGEVFARIQGAGSEAYECSIKCEFLNAAQRDELLQELYKRPLMLAQLMMRQLPLGFDELFERISFRLIPADRKDLKTRCNCPDRVNPCKHLAALFYLMIEAFDHDPLLLLALRGVGREDLVGKEDALPLETIEEEMRDRCLVADAKTTHQSFWGLDQPVADTPDFGPEPVGNEEAPLARRLGALPLWRGEERFLEVIGQCSKRAVSMGWQAWAGERFVRPAVSGGIEGAPLQMRPRRMRISTDEN